jgi:hypothetical protein
MSAEAPVPANIPTISEQVRKRRFKSARTGDNPRRLFFHDFEHISDMDYVLVQIVGGQH